MSARRRTALATVGTALLCAGLAQAEGNRVKFPEDLDQLVHYMTVRRGNATEHLLTTREAIAAVKGGRPIPNGTRFVLRDHRDDKLYRYFVMEKGEGWGADYNGRSGDWQFQWFWPDRQINTAENTTRCVTCHQSQRNSEFLFSARRITEYVDKPVE